MGHLTNSYIPSLSNQPHLTQHQDNKPLLSLSDIAQSTGTSIRSAAQTTASAVRSIGGFLVNLSSSFQQQSKHSLNANTFTQAQAQTSKSKVQIHTITSTLTAEQALEQQKAAKETLRKSTIKDTAIFVTAASTVVVGMFAVSGLTAGISASISISLTAFYQLAQNTLTSKNTTACSIAAKTVEGSVLYYSYRNANFSTLTTHIILNYVALPATQLAFFTAERSAVQLLKLAQKSASISSSSAYHSAKGGTQLAVMIVFASLIPPNTGAPASYPTIMDTSKISPTELPLPINATTPTTHTTQTASTEEPTLSTQVYFIPPLFGAACSAILITTSLIIRALRKCQACYRAHSYRQLTDVTNHLPPTNSSIQSSETSPLLNGSAPENASSTPARYLLDTPSKVETSSDTSDNIVTKKNELEETYHEAES